YKRNRRATSSTDGAATAVSLNWLPREPRRTTRGFIICESSGLTLGWTYDASNSMSTIDDLHFVRGSDSLGRDTPLPFRHEHQLFGLPLVIESNAERVIAWTRDLFEPDPSEPVDAAGTDAPLCLRVIIEPHRGSAWVASKVHWHLPDADHAVASGAGLDAFLDLANGRGTLYVDECVLRERGPEY